MNRILIQNYPNSMQYLFLLRGGNLQKIIFKVIWVFYPQKPQCIKRCSGIFYGTHRCHSILRINTLRELFWSVFRRSVDTGKTTTQLSRLCHRFPTASLSGVFISRTTLPQMVSPHFDHPWLVFERELSSHDFTRQCPSEPTSIVATFGYQALHSTTNVSRTFFIYFMFYFIPIMTASSSASSSLMTPAFFLSPSLMHSV